VGGIEQNLKAELLSQESLHQVEALVEDYQPRHHHSTRGAGDLKQYYDQNQVAWEASVGEIDRHQPFQVVHR
jgi:hypothetical protein